MIRQYLAAAKLPDYSHRLKPRISVSGPIERIEGHPTFAASMKHGSPVWLLDQDAPEAVGIDGVADSAAPVSDERQGVGDHLRQAVNGYAQSKPRHLGHVRLDTVYLLIV